MDDKITDAFFDEDTCDSCCGKMEWCEGCRMYTKTCCEQYGTCMCS